VRRTTKEETIKINKDYQNFRDILMGVERIEQALSQKNLDCQRENELKSLYEQAKLSLSMAGEKLFPKELKINELCERMIEEAFLNALRYLIYQSWDVQDFLEAMPKTIWDNTLSAEANILNAGENRIKKMIKKSEGMSFNILKLKFDNRYLVTKKEPVLSSIMDELSKMSVFNASSQETLNHVCVKLGTKLITDYINKHAKSEFIPFILDGIFNFEDMVDDYRWIMGETETHDIDDNGKIIPIITFEQCSDVFTDSLTGKSRYDIQAIRDALKAGFNASADTMIIGFKGWNECRKLQAYDANEVSDNIQFTNVR
jgi:hypothetical protein